MAQSSRHDFASPGRTFSTQSTRRLIEQTGSRSIRLFVSSSFKDMELERTLLKDQIFPQIRAECRKRGLLFDDVDLRWGIEEGSDAADTVSICLTEVYRSRPFFVAILGQRYGWCPPQNVLDTTDLATVSNHIDGDQKWFQQRHGASITHLEIEAGIHQVPEDDRRCLVYCREPSYSQQQVDTGAEPQMYFCTSAEEEKRLQDLVEDLQTLPNVPMMEYQTPEEVCEHIGRDLMTLIDKDFPLQDDLDPLQFEETEHRNFAITRVERYVDLPAVTGLLRSLQKVPTGCWLLSGPSGSGKSSALSKFVLALEHSEALVFYHFVGYTNYSASVLNLLQRWLWKLKQLSHGAIVDPIPKDVKAMSSTLPSWIAQVALAHDKTKVYIVLDALNQLLDDDGAHQLAWLPEVLPHNVILVTSCTEESPMLQVLEERHQCKNMPLDALTSEARGQLAQSYFKTHGKHLDTSRIDLISQANHIVSPLHLQLLLDELRITATYSTVGDALSGLLANGSATDLIHRIVKRWSEQFDQPLQPGHRWAPDGATYSQGLVSSTLCYILACKHGITERELLDLLGVERQAVATFFHHLHGVMQVHQGLLSFAHATFSEAVRKLYLEEDATTQALHIALGAYFQGSQHARDRQCQEVPHHLQRAKQTDQLTNFMCQQAVFEHMWSTESRRLAMTVVWQQLPCEEAYSTWMHEMDDIALQTNDDSTAAVKAFALRLYKAAQALHWMGQFLKAFDFYLWALVVVLKQARLPYAQVHQVDKDRPQPRSRSAPVTPSDRPNQRKKHKKRRPEEEPDYQLIKELMTVPVVVPSIPSLPILDPECPTLEQLDSACVFVCLILESFGRLCAHQSHHSNATMLYQRARELRSAMDGESAGSTTAVLGNLAWSMVVKKDFFGQQGAATLLKTAIVNECATLCEEDGLAIPPTSAKNNKIPRIDRCELNHPAWNALLDHLDALCHQPGGSQRISRILPPFVNRLALINTTLENFIVAQKLFKVSLGLHIACFGTRHPATATVYFDMGLLYLAQVRKALKSARQLPSPSATAAASAASSPPPTRGLPRSVSAQPKTTNPKNSMPRLRSVPTGSDDVDRYVDLAIAALDHAQDIRAETLGRQHAFYATVLISKADVYMLQDDKETAREMYEEARAIRAACFGSDSRAVEAVDSRLNGIRQPNRSKNRKAKTDGRARKSHS
eukprot:m.236953 g.236953  ORF g.236953 m.236953 type:complete len:1193 (-) comp17416_c0_seq9:3218-6796(-)